MKTQSPLLLAVLTFCLSVLSLSSCKKDKEPAEPTNTTPGLYMKLDGADLAFPNYDRATRNEMNGVYSLTISAAKDPSEISITLISHNWDFNAGNVYHYAAAGFSEGYNQLFYCPDNNAFDECSESLPPSGQEAALTVNITDSNTEFVKGTFSGTIFLRSGTNKKSVVTDGRFYVRFPQ